MNILFLTPRLLFPVNRGDKVRPFNFARVLSKRHSLSLISLVESEEEFEFVNPLRKIFDKVEAVLLKPWQSKWNLFVNLFSNTPLQVSYYHSNEIQKRIAKIIEKDNPDVIYTFHLRMAPYVADFKGAYKILDLTDSVSLFLQRMLQYQKVYLKPILYNEWLRVKNYEPYIAEKFDECWLISKVDKESIGKCRSNIEIIPNGIDYNYFSSKKQNAESTNIIFVGYMSFESTNAVLYFYKDIFPYIQREIRSARFYIIGANPPKRILKLGKDQSVTVTGFVNDLRPYYNRAAVMVAPMRFVVGMQNKILEAMAIEVPVVTTNLGNEGIDAQIGKEIFVEDDPRDFANRVVELLRDKNLRREIGASARKFVERHFTWGKVAERMDEIGRKIEK